MPWLQTLFPGLTVLPYLTGFARRLRPFRGDFVTILPYFPKRSFFPPGILRIQTRTSFWLWARQPQTPNSQNPSRVDFLASDSFAPFLPYETQRRPDSSNCLKLCFGLWPVNHFLSLSDTFLSFLNLISYRLLFREDYYAQGYRLRSLGLGICSHFIAIAEALGARLRTFPREGTGDNTTGDP